MPSFLRPSGVRKETPGIYCVTDERGTWTLTEHSRHRSTVGIKSPGKCLSSLAMLSECHPDDGSKATLGFDVSFRICFCEGQMHVIVLPSFLTHFCLRAMTQCQQVGTVRLLSIKHKFYE